MSYVNEPDCRSCGETGSWYGRDGKRVRTRSQSFKKLTPEKREEILQSALALCRYHAAATDWADAQSVATSGRERFCAKCGGSKPEEQFSKRGMSFHPWCKQCCSVYHAVRKKEKDDSPAKKYPWLDGKFYESHGLLGEMLLELELITSKCARYSLRATTNKQLWRAYYEACEKREEVRSKLLSFLETYEKT